MLKHWIVILFSIGSAVGCTAQAQRREKAARARSEALERDLKASEAARQKAESKAGTLQTSLDDLSQKLAANDAQLSTLEANLKSKEEELSRLNAAGRAEGLSAEEFKAKLAAAEKARDEALRDLEAAREQEKMAMDSLDQQKDRAVQIFLENPGPDTMFALDVAGMAEKFKLDGRECAVVLDMAQDVELLRGPAMEKLPIIQSFDVLPMRVAYNKVLVCRQGRSLQVGRETGYLVRGQSNSAPSDRKLITARDKGMCDKRPEAIAKASVFGEWKYQILEPYLGDVDGIETIDILRSSGAMLRLNSGSAEMSVPSCAEAQGVADDSSVALLACKVLLDERISGYDRVDGCFTEKKDGENTSLVFHP